MERVAPQLEDLKRVVGGHGKNSGGCSPLPLRARTYRGGRAADPRGADALGWWVGVVKMQGAAAPYRVERDPIGARGRLERVAPPRVARSTATKVTLKAGGGYSPRPS